MSTTTDPQAPYIAAPAPLAGAAGEGETPSLPLDAIAQLVGLDIFNYQTGDVVRAVGVLRGQIKRLYPLVKYQREALHEAKLIDDREFAELSAIGFSYILDTYDELRARTEKAEAEATTLRARLAEETRAAAEARERLKRFDDIIQHNGMMLPGLSHVEVASKVRMLTRSDLDHEMVTVLARNRIITLANLLGDARTEAAEAEREKLALNEELRGLRAELDEVDVWLLFYRDGKNIGQILAAKGNDWRAVSPILRSINRAVRNEDAALSENHATAALPLVGDEGKEGRSNG